MHIELDASLICTHFEDKQQFDESMCKPLAKCPLASNTGSPTLAMASIWIRFPFLGADHVNAGKANMDDIIAQLGHHGVVPVVTISRPNDIIPLAEAMVNGGLPCLEIAFRTAAAEEALKVISDVNPNILVGAGTVLSVDQAKEALSSGASFIVSPGFDSRIVSWCIEREVTVVPGVATPTEIIMALDYGLKFLKFFPAETFGGVTTLTAIGAPYPGVKFIPTGGINAKNLAAYLRIPSVHCCGMSWLAKRNLIEAGDFDEITRRAKEAVKIVQEVHLEAGEK